MSNRRRQRRADLSRYRGLARHGLVTWLVDISNRLDDAPLLARARIWWLDALPGSPPRGCLVCKGKFASRGDVGALLISAPSINATSAGMIGVCVACWGTADRPGVELEAIETAATRALRAVVVNGVFEPLRSAS